MNVETKRRLLDALEACRAIQQFSAGIDYNAFLSDEMRQAALERKFEILGEALNRAEQILNLRIVCLSCGGSYSAAKKMGRI